ncbi:BrnA antitoxin family protein [Pseudanabaena galeata UHCC 0370]|jgi:uncharacterized protein (DUF4415 family)|uniref:BrnA antitoxin family protein n=1 Tax=Pseudanabaena galeata UHCC 0370 TaxID=3110310 RepID=A0ABU5TQQ4_9CYAN|nr:MULTISPECIES: BrnA antitoxin family protein [Pseudanabaena]MCL1491533.1 BrnA antitoxin family protein [Pseudanabaena sp. Salubria-1]MEA5480631.1 BrnA antitoxin family protein [Pseudanabaena galeata UHCC 0370]MEA5486335.1 BrnA antitoxin family protein [Pseudanabaena sp. CCNP1317]WGS71646.1 BrnA antitoxin family protein [Pseudanabaena galeata CCNP1313]
MKDEYDFSDSVQNPYFKKLKKQMTIRLEEEVVDYFKNLSEEVGIPYQSLINLYLRDCVRSHKRLSLDWVQGV